ncbi:hypothetical protein [Burkholderia orbicola]|uniref:hypothetical protein n=1 Tax=Burkholderia orbicola TaxID=2978683 RepID=UPI002FE171E6
MLELRQHYPLAGLLQLAGLAPSTFYYQQRTLQRGDKYADLKLKIRELFDRHKGRYGYGGDSRVISTLGVPAGWVRFTRLAPGQPPRGPGLLRRSIAALFYFSRISVDPWSV